MSNMENQEVKNGRRSSILKPPRSPSRNVLLELNSDIVEKRKSLNNKRVSFADKFEVAVFDRELSKELEGSQENNPLDGSSISYASQHHLQSSQGISLVPQGFGEHVANSTLNDTVFFHNTLSNMSDITRRRTLESCTDTSPLNQLNSTNNAVEDMSLTLPLANALPTVCNVFPANNLSVEEKSFSKMNFTLDVHGLSQESVGVIGIDTVERPRIIPDLALHAYSEISPELTLAEKVENDENRNALLNVSMFCSAGDISMDLDSDSSKEMVFQKINPPLAFPSTEMEVNLAPPFIPQDPALVSTGTLFLNESMALTTLADIPQDELSVPVLHADDFENKTINFSRSMELDSIDIRTDENLVEQNIYSNGDNPINSRNGIGLIISTEQPLEILPTRVENQRSSVNCSPPHEEPLFVDSNYNSEQHRPEQCASEKTPLPPESCDAVDFEPRTETDIFGKGLGLVPALMSHMQPTVQELAPIKDVSSEISNLPPPVFNEKPKILGKLNPRGAMDPFSVLTDKMGAIRLKPTQEHIEKCKVNVMINRRKETPGIRETCSKNEVKKLDKIQPEDVYQNNDVVFSKALTSVGKHSEPQALPVENASVTSPPCISVHKKSFAPNLNILLKAQAILKSPSRIPVRQNVKGATPTPSVLKTVKSNKCKATMLVAKCMDTATPVQQPLASKPEDECIQASKKCASAQDTQKQKEPVSGCLKDEHLLAQNTLETCIRNPACIPKITFNLHETDVSSSGFHHSSHAGNSEFNLKNKTSIKDGGSGGLTPVTHSKAGLKMKTPTSVGASGGLTPVTPQREPDRLYTTPSKLRSVTRHSCIHSSGRRSMPRRSTSTPRSHPRIRLSDKRPVIYRTPGSQPPAKRQNLNSASSAKSASFNIKTLNSQKHAVTPVSDRRKPSSKKLCLDEVQSSTLLDENFPLVEGYSLNSEFSCSAAAPQSHSTKPEDVSSIKSYKSEDQLHKENADGSMSVNLHSSALSVAQLATVNISGASPLLTTRTKEFFSGECTPDSCQDQPVNPRKSLQEDFEQSSPTSALPVSADIGCHSVSNETAVIKNYTFTRPDHLTFVFTPEEGLEKEINKLMKSELLAEEWKFEVKNLSKGVVYFYHTIDVFYISVCFQRPDLQDGDPKLGRRMSNITVNFNNTGFEKKYQENPIALKIINHHLTTNLENYKHSSRLPELLMDVTDSFFRGQSLKRDLHRLSSYLVSPMTFNDEETTIDVCLLSLNLMARAALRFTVKFETYPFAAIRPDFIDIDNGSQFQSDVMAAMMNEKIGELYLWRMFQAAIRILKKEEILRPLIKSPPLHTILFINCKK